MKWNESGFMPLLCIYRLNWARRTSLEWWDGIALQTQDSKFKPCGLRSSTLSLGHGGSPQYWVLRLSGEETFFFFKPPRPGNEPRTLAWKAEVLPSGPRPENYWHDKMIIIIYNLILNMSQPSKFKVHSPSNNLVWRIYKKARNVIGSLFLKR